MLRLHVINVFIAGYGDWATDCTTGKVSISGKGGVG